MNSTEFCGGAGGYQTSHYLFVIVNSVSAIVTIFGNSLVLVTIWRTPRLHSPSNVLLAGLALSDLGVGLICQPTWIILEMASNRAHCSIYDVALWIYILSAEFFVDVSLVTLTAISVERYLALRLNLRYQELVTVKRVLIVLVTIWMADVLVFVWGVFHNNSAFILQLSVFLTCVLLTVWCYFKIFQTIRRHQAQIKAQVVLPHNAGPNLPNIERHKNSVFTMLYIVAIFMISYLPWLTVVVISNFIMLGSTVWTTVLTLVFVNSCVNPALYCWRLAQVRQAVKEIVQTCSAC